MSEESDETSYEGPPSPEEILEQIVETKRSVTDEGRPIAVKKMHKRDALTARERIKYLCDDDTFDEMGQLAAPEPSTPETTDWTREDAPADGLVTGIGEVSGRTVAVGSFDYTVKGGSIGHTGFVKLRRLFDLSMNNGYPVILLHEGGGHRIQEGLDAKTIAHGDFKETFDKLAQLSGWVPLVSAIMGPGFAGPTNYAALCDYVPIVEHRGSMGIAGPEIVKAALGIDISKDDYDSRFHTSETGIAHRSFASDEACLDSIMEYLAYFPQSASEQLPETEANPPSDADIENLLQVVPPNPKKAYDVHDIIRGVVDQESLFEYQPEFAKSIITGLARIAGSPIGIIANNPKFKAGTIDVDVTNKAPRFISLCDAFNIPVVAFVDVPGFLPGPEQERRGLARTAGKFIYELARATTPIINVTVRRGYGFAYISMGGGRNQNQLNLVWPTAEIAGMSIEGAVSIAYEEEIEKAENPERKHQELVQKFKSRTGPQRAAEGAGIDAVIDPRETRDIIKRTLNRADSGENQSYPPKKHPVPPL